MNMFTKFLETLGNNFWLIIILCFEVILAVWLLCFARGKKKNRAAEQCGELRFSCKRICVRDVLNLFNVQTAPFAPVRTALLTAGALIALMVIWIVDLKSLFVLPLGGAVTVLLGCIAGDCLGAKKPCRRLSSFCGNFDKLIVKIDGFAKKVDEFLMM